MAQATTKDLTTLPVGRLGLIPLISCKDLGEKVNEWLIQWRKERSHEELDSFAFEGYQRESYLIPVQTARFGSGEAKCTIMESVRGDDIYLMVDVCNYSLTYSIGPYENLMSPDDHFQDLKRVIGAIGGKARRVNVIMPYLYESRQNIRSGRESLDCATALQELVSMGVENIITFDAHDARVQNATPLHGFETIQPSYQFIKALLNHEKGLHIDNDHFMIISPDEGSMNRAIYLANILGVDMGMYYKRLDYSKRINGRHPIAAYEFLGPNLKGKDMILIDDMISSGDTVLKITSLLKERGAGRRKIERFRIFNMEFMLGKMSRSRYRIVRRIRGGNNQIYIRNIIRQFRQGVTNSLHTHRINIFLGFCLRPGTDPGALFNPLAG